MNIFIFDGTTNTLKINEYEILLVKEFADLWDESRNKCKEDKNGKNRLLAYKEFTYIFLALDFKSPYLKWTEKQRHEAALADSGLNEEHLKDEKFKAAYHKYDQIQNTDPFLELIKTAYKTLRKTKIFLDSIDFNNDIDSEGRPLYKPKDVMADIGKIGKMRVQLDELEKSYKANLEASSDIRGGGIIGFDEA